MTSMELSINVPLKIGLSGKTYEIEDMFQLMSLTITKLQKLTPTIFYFFHPKLYTAMKNQFPNTECVIVNSADPPIDYVLTFGGDGTILQTASKFPHGAPPFLCFQKGTLGFLCKFSVKQIESVLENLVKYRKQAYGDDFPFRIDNRMRIQAVIKSSNSTQEHSEIICLNEVTLSRHSPTKIITQIYINNQFLTETAGDGLLVSTPTGSTAYALSAGGPIMESGVDSILIVPICPYSLSFRPICFSASSTIKLKMVENSRYSDGVINFDGQGECVLKSGDEVLIKKSDYGLTFFEPKEQDKSLPGWMSRLKVFLGWNQIFKSPSEENQEKEIAQQEMYLSRRKSSRM